MLEGRFAALRWLVAVVALAMVGGWSTPRAQGQARLFLSVVDANGAPVTDLSTDEFEITWGDATSDILSAELAREPMKVTVLVDNSGTVSDASLEHIRDGLRLFLRAMPERSEVALITLARQPRWVVRHTTDRAELERGVDRIVPDGGSGVALLDGLVEAGDRVGDDEQRREVIVAVSTNVGETSNSKQADYERLVRRV